MSAHTQHKNTLLAAWLQQQHRTWHVAADVLAAVQLGKAAAGPLDHCQVLCAGNESGGGLELTHPSNHTTHQQHNTPPPPCSSTLHHPSSNNARTLTRRYVLGSSMHWSIASRRGKPWSSAGLRHRYSPSKPSHSRMLIVARSSMLPPAAR